jgi:hypothetical protein
MNENTSNNNNSNSNSGNDTATPTMSASRKTSTGAKVAGGAVAAGLFVSALLFFRPDSGKDAAPAEGPAAVDVLVGSDEDVPASGAGSDELSGGGNDALLGGGSDELSGGANDALLDTAAGLFDEADELDPDTLDAILDGTDQGPLPEPVVVEPAPAPAPRPGLAQMCPSVQHGDGSSGIWVRGSVYGLADGWIFVEGPTINDGAPVEVPIVDGAFDSPMPITQFGDHQVTRFELGTDSIDGFEPVDLLPTLLDGPGDVFPVGPDEGSLFDVECFEFIPESSEVIDDLLIDEEIVEGGGSDDGSTGDDGADTQTHERLELEVNDFLGAFVDAHVTGDADFLQRTLHPSIRLAYGDDVCTEYVARTIGSLTGATLIDVGVPQRLDMSTPSGPINFPEAIPFTVEFEVADGSTFVNDAHLPVHDGEVRWLTTCGVEAP